MASASATKTAWAVSGYMLCSATLLIGNKYAVHKVAAPSFILWAQLFGTAVAVKAAHLLGLISHLDAIEPTKVRAFMPVALIFCATIFTNIKSLEHANVETFMIFRFSTPLCVSVCDYLFLGRHLPSSRSWLSLLALLVGAVGYGTTDSAFVVKGYLFCGLWHGRRRRNFRRVAAPPRRRRGYSFDESRRRRGRATWLFRRGAAVADSAERRVAAPPWLIPQSAVSARDEVRSCRQR